MTAAHSAVPAARSGSAAGPSSLPPSSPPAPQPSAASPSAVSPSSPVLPFVGRRAELSALRGALRDPSVRAAVLTGPVGIGKSRAGEEFLRAAERAGHRCWRVRATEAAASVPLLALAPLLPSRTSEDPAELFHEVRRVVAGPGPRPVALVDDVHRLDAASLALLALLAEQAGLFLLATLTAESALPEALRTWWRQDALRPVALGPLPAADGARLLRETLGGPVAAPARAAFAEAGAGNPLLLRELVRAATASGVLREVGGVWCLDGPLERLTVDGMASEQLPELSREQRTVLELLALCGPVGLDDALRYAPLDVLAELEELDLVTVRTEERRTRAALAHPWHVAPLRARVTPLRARSLLLAQAARVRAHGARRAGDELALAQWELDATGSADPELLVRAAGQALREDDVAAMSRLARAALQHGPNVPAGLMLGESLAQQGEFAEAVPVLHDAFAAADGDTEVESAAVTLAQTLCFGLEELDWAQAVLAEAVGRIGPRPALAACAAFELSAAGRTGEALRALGEQPFGGRRFDQFGVLGLQAQLRTELASGRVEDAVATGCSAHEAHRRLTERDAVFYPARNLYLLAVAMLEAGRLEEARAAALEGQQELLLRPVPALAAWFPWALGRIALERGRPVRALEHFREARAQARLRHHPFSAGRALAGAVLAAAQLGQVAPEAAELTEDAGADAEFRNWDTVRARAWVALCGGNLPTATALLRSAAGHALADGEVTAAVAMLDDLVRWGALGEADALAAAAARMQGPYAAARARLALATAADRPEEIEAASGELADLGYELRAAEGFTAAAHRWQAAGHRARATRAGQRAQDLGARCEGATTPGLAPLSGADPLSSRERVIALMAARGRTSREIAAECVLSPRTVDNHLARIYRKLGISNRTELPAILFPTGC